MRYGHDGFTFAEDEEILGEKNGTGYPTVYQTQDYAYGWFISNGLEFFNHPTAGWDRKSGTTYTYTSDDLGTMTRALRLKFDTLLFVSVLPAVMNNSDGTVTSTWNSGASVLTVNFDG